MTKVLVCGGRDYNDGDHVWNTLCELDTERGPFEVVIHGAATGADTEGMIWAQTLGRKHAPFQADWRAHGRSAGPLRNERMLREGRPDLVVAFPGGRGTADMVRRARDAGVEVIEVAAIADRNPEGGNEVPSRSDESGGSRSEIAQPSPPPPSR